MKRIAILTLILCLLSMLPVSAAVAPSSVAPAPVVDSLPFETFADMQPYIVAGQPSSCSGGAVLFLRLEVGSDAYGVWLSPETERVAIVLWKGNIQGAPPNSIWTGSIDAEGRMRLLRETFDPSVHRSPCDPLFPSQV